MPTVAATLAARVALDGFFTANPKVAGVLAACADAGLTADATREVIAARGLTKEARRAFLLAKAAAGPLDFGGHSSLESPGLPGRSTPFRAPDAPSTYDAAKAPRLPTASGPSSPDPSPSWGQVGGDYARRLYTGAKGGLTAALGTGARAVTGIGQGAVGAANWATGTPSEQSPWANYLSGAQESLGQFAGAGAQNVANAFNGAQPTSEPGFDALAQQHAQHQQWADQAIPDGWNALPGQASHVGGLAAAGAMGAKAMTSMPGQAGQLLSTANRMAPAYATSGMAAGAAGLARGMAGQVKALPSTAVGGFAGGAGSSAVMLGAQRAFDGSQAAPGAPQAPKFPDTVDIDVSRMTPQHAQEYIGNGMQGFSDAIQKLKLEDPNQPGWREKAVPELAAPLRAMAVGVAARTGKNPRELFDQVMANGPQAVDFDHLQSLASVPGNEAFAQPPPDKPTGRPETMGAPPPNAPGAQPQPQPQGGAGGLLGGSNPLQGIWSFLNNDQIDPWARTGVAVGIPLAVIGALSGMLGEGGIGSLLMTIFGVGSTLAGAHAGGLADLGKAFGTLTGGWGAQGGAAGQQAAQQAPPPPVDDLAQLGQLPPQERMNRLFPQSAGMGDHARKITQLSQQFDPDQLAGLLRGASPADVQRLESGLSAAPTFSLFGSPSIPAEVKAEMLDAIRRHRASGAS